MSSAIEQESAGKDWDEAEKTGSRVTPVVPPPSDWLHEFDECLPDLRAPRAATEEDVFWSTPPRYSLLLSLAPTSIAPTPSRRRRWSARLLFATIFCTVVTFLVLEVRSLTLHESSTSTNASSVEVANSP